MCPPFEVAPLPGVTLPHHPPCSLLLTCPFTMACSGQLAAQIIAEVPLAKSPRSPSTAGGCSRRGGKKFDVGGVLDLEGGGEKVYQISLSSLAIGGSPGHHHRRRSATG